MENFTIVKTAALTAGLLFSSLSFASAANLAENDIAIHDGAIYRFSSEKIAIFLKLMPTNMPRNSVVTPRWV